MDAIVGGTVTVDEARRCVWTMNAPPHVHLFVFPYGSTVRWDPFEVRLPDGKRVRALDETFSPGARDAVARCDPSEIAFPNEGPVTIKVVAGRS